MQNTSKHQKEPASGGLGWELWGGGMAGIGADGQKVQTSSYSSGYVMYSMVTMLFSLVYFKVAKRADFKSLP